MELEDWLNGKILSIIRGGFPKSSMDGLYVIGTCGECKYAQEIKGNLQYIDCAEITPNEQAFLKSFGCIDFEKNEGVDKVGTKP